MNPNLMNKMEECNLSLEKLHAALEQLGNVYMNYGSGIGKGLLPAWGLIRTQYPKAQTLYLMALDYARKAKEQMKKALEMQAASDEGESQ